jgi:hypothetical protein
MGEKISRYIVRSANKLGIPVGVFLEKQLSGQKWCCRCKEWQPIVGFIADRSNADGLGSFCKASTHRLVKTPNRGSGMKGKSHSEETRLKMSAARKGSGNKNWRGGKTSLTRRARQHAGYQRWRKEVLTRDGRRCRRCQVFPPRPHVHHIKPFRTHPHLALSVDNGLTVCGHCHRSIHAGEQ